MDKLTRRVKDFARQLGADLVGVAGKECFSRLPFLKPDELLPDAQSVVVIATKRSPHSLMGDGTWEGQEHYLGFLALEMNILLRTSGFLDDEGFNTYTVGHHGYFIPNDANIREAAKHLSVTRDGELRGVEEFEKVYWGQMKIISHVYLGEEAGLGEIGLCRQLVTPQYGPRVGLVSLITSAPLEPDGKLKEPVCKKEECTKCIEYCRSGALTVDSYNVAKCMFQMGALPKIDYIRRGDKEAIARHFHSMRTKVFPFERGDFRWEDTAGGEPRGGFGCGMCILACPVGKRHEDKPRLTSGTASVSGEIY
ncbi:MAG: hypothetical protein PVJ61_06850 [Dehalococcoidia bacterium]|jgi:epoxyqueuosine reductase QueG